MICIALEVLTKVEGLHRTLDVMGIASKTVGAGVQATAILLTATGVLNAFLAMA